MARCLPISLCIVFASLGNGLSAVRPPGILAQQVPQVWAQAWRNLPAGEGMFDVQVHRGKVMVLFFFQSWCPGYHRRGFPALAATVARYRDAQDVVFAAMQTVFEGFLVDTPETAWSSAAQSGLQISIGHDLGPKGTRSLTMKRFHRGGTP